MVVHFPGHFIDWLLRHYVGTFAVTLHYNNLLDQSFLFRSQSAIVGKLMYYVYVIRTETQEKGGMKEKVR